MFSRYRHIIWDWNGTLLDDAWLCIEIINGLLGRRGLPVLTPARYAESFTFPVQEYYRRIGFDFTREPFAVLAAEFVAEYDRRRFDCGLQPHAREVLGTLGARCTQSILSAYEQGRLDEMVRANTLDEIFTHRIGLSDYYAVSKVDHGRAHLAALGHAPAEVVLIGDTLHDVEVAQALGIDCLLISSGHQSQAVLAAAGVPVLPTLADLLTVGAPSMTR